MKRFEVIHNLIKNINNPIGAEIGVCDGMFTEFMLSNNPTLTLYAIDPYTLYQQNYQSGIKQHNHNTQQDFDNQYKLTKSKLDKFNNRCILLRQTSVEASKIIEDFFLDFVFIDGNHLYDFVKEDILIYYKKVKWHGIVSGHDYNPMDKNHLINTCRAVNEIFDREDLNFSDDSTWWIMKGVKN